MAMLDYYLTLKLRDAGRVKGESTCKGYEDDIIIESFSWREEGVVGGKPVPGIPGVSTPGTTLGDFKFKMKSNRASAVIMLACAKKDYLVEAVLKGLRDTAMGKQEFLKWTLKDGAIWSYEMAGSTEDVLPVDNFTIKFGEIAIDYKPLNSDRLLGPAFSAVFNLGDIQ
jgi:type VI protein secretion system component Hcp